MIFLVNIFIYVNISCWYFNMLFTSAVSPSALKVDKVVPAHKKDSELEFFNYWPISFLWNLEKILEKLMHTRIFELFNNNNLFYPLQLGFRQNYSTTYALLSLTETITKYLDEGTFACSLTKSFWHSWTRYSIDKA